MINPQQTNFLKSIQEHKRNFIKYINRNNLYYTSSDNLLNLRPKQLRSYKYSNFLKIGAVAIPALIILSSLNNAPKENNLVIPKPNVQLSSPIKEQKIEEPLTQIKQSVNPQQKYNTFIELLKVTEGKAKNFYLDNVGIAIGYGWNPTRNSKEFNTEIANHLKISKKDTKHIVELSSSNKVKTVPTPLKKFTLSNSQLKKSAVFMFNFYETEFIKIMTNKSIKYNKDNNFILKQYHNMPLSQQAVMVHMAYKLGANNLNKYDTFFKYLFEHMEKPSKQTLSKVTDNLNYMYKNRKGTYVHDVATTKMHTEYFVAAISPKPKY